MSLSTEKEVLECQRKLLDAIATCDWATYEQLCAEDMTCFEPEAVGHLVEGMAFHKFYFDFLAEVDGYRPPVNTISAPHVRVMAGGSVAVVSYLRLLQKVKEGRPLTQATEETRVWEKRNGCWKNVHFHRSPAPSS